MKKVVVTGANGFIGRHCLDFLLKAGFEVHALGFPERLENSENVYWYSSDLHDYLQTAGLFRKIKPAYLLHLAWYTTPGEYKNSLENLRWVQSSLELIKIFQRYGGKRLVVAGTCAEYKLQYGYLHEYSTPDANDSLYGTCKSGLARIIEAYSLVNGLSSAWGRIFYLYGPYEDPNRLVPHVINCLLNNEVVICSNGEQILDYLYVKDVASALVCLLQSSIDGIINIGSGIPVSVKDLHDIIGRKLGRNNLITFNDKMRMPGETAFIVANNEKLGNQLGWKPSYGLENGLDETIAWWKSPAGKG